MNNKEILKLIDDDISYQEKHLVNDFEKDKSIQWRITGFQDLKKRIVKGGKKMDEEETMEENKIEINFKRANGNIHTLTWRDLDKETFRAIEEFFNYIKIRR